MISNYQLIVICRAKIIPESLFHRKNKDFWQRNFPVLWEISLYFIGRCIYLNTGSSGDERRRVQVNNLNPLLFNCSTRYERRSN